MKALYNTYKNNISNSLITKKIIFVSQQNGLSEDIQYVLVKLFDYMQTKKLCGACHALSAVLYVALCELGEKPDLYIGECYNPNVPPFDHSWVVLNNKIIDIAIYFPLFEIVNSISGVIVMDIDVVSQEKTKTIYGYKTKAGLGSEATHILSVPFVTYMDNFPFEDGGLWSVVKKILPQSFKSDNDAIKNKYTNVSRIVV